MLDAVNRNDQMKNDQANQLLDKLSGTISAYELEHMILGAYHSLPRKLKAALRLREEKLANRQQLQVEITLTRYRLNSMEDIVEKTMAETLLSATEIPQRRMLSDLEADIVVIDAWLDKQDPTSFDDIADQLEAAEPAHWANSVGHHAAADMRKKHMVSKETAIEINRLPEEDRIQAVQIANKLCS